MKRSKTKFQQQGSAADDPIAVSSSDEDENENEDEDEKEEETKKSRDGEEADDDNDDNINENESDQTERYDSPVVMSFDLGENATAYCKGRIRRGKKSTIDGVGVATLGVISSARDAVVAVSDLFRRLPIADFYVIEEQPPINQKTRMMEVALATLASKIDGAVVVHVPTSRMTKAYGLPTGHERRKRESTIIAKRILTSNRLRVSETVFDTIAAVKRKHDIADAIIQYSWFVHEGANEIADMYRENPNTTSFRATAPANRSAERRREVVKKQRLQKKFHSVVAGERKRKRGMPPRSFKRRKT